MRADELPGSEDKLSSVRAVIQNSDPAGEGRRRMRIAWGRIARRRTTGVRLISIDRQAVKRRVGKFLLRLHLLFRTGRYDRPQDVEFDAG